ncbi:hypothetical protein LUZ60_000687 [Juncus effusus]|nr:hypothetical protein LUZ60_000687 [Juncus effusus]
MEPKSLHLLISLCFLLFVSFSSPIVAYNGQNKLQNYIIIIRSTPKLDFSVPENAKTWHTSLLSTVCKDSAASRLIYSYNKVVNGFAARLTENELNEMSQQPWFMRAILDNKPYELTTTHTPDFLQLRGSRGLWRRNKNMGEGIIIGVLDTGIAPGHPSFDDKGMPPPPAKWRGHCDFNGTLCNNKLIGAKSFLKAGEEELKHISPFDTVMHGTHTASTAAGAYVRNTSLMGTTLGLASGIAPRAHIAVYKVCNENGCQGIDTLKAMEEAVKDGCDVLSLSLGGRSSASFYADPISVGGFYAIQNGVFVSTSAGNNGPNTSTVSNQAPWLLTVAASTTDRQIRSTVKLGNGVSLDGEGLYPHNNLMGEMIPLAYFGAQGDVEAGQCLNGVLDNQNISGKIVVCDASGVAGNGDARSLILQAGGLGLIVVSRESDGYTPMPSIHPLPTTTLTYNVGEELKNYIKSTAQPVATFLFKGVVLHNNWTPSIASFSARGPNTESPLILKPDITGPGVSIVAAIPPVLRGEETIQFGILSGTSMSCPHLSGIAALIKKEHQDWSPAAIKSAMMTTASVMNYDGKPISDEKHLPADVLAMGAGHINANKALDPGLIYDIQPEEYTRYLCGLGYEDDKVSSIVYPNPAVKCAELKTLTQEQLNYPSIAVPLSTNNTMEINRTVTNVGMTNVTYKALINVPKAVSVTVVPNTLQFTSMNETKSFSIIFKSTGETFDKLFGDLKWVSSKYIVRSPIMIQFGA